MRINCSDKNLTDCWLSEDLVAATITMQKTNSLTQAHSLIIINPFIRFNLENEDSWKQRCLRQQIDDELNRRVRDALETPPLERLRRRQLQQQAKAWVDFDIPWPHRKKTDAVGFCSYWNHVTLIQSLIQIAVSFRISGVRNVTIL